MNRTNSQLILYVFLLVYLMYFLLLRDKNFILKALNIEDEIFELKRENISAFYTCHDEIRSVNKVLSHFRKSYPRAPIYMFNDAGNSFLRHLSMRYKAKYHYYREHAVTVSRGNYWNSSDKAFRYVKDLIFTAVDSMSDWVILLEDDSMVLKPLHMEDLRYDMNGADVDFMPQTYWWDVIQTYIGNHTPGATLHSWYNGCGGTVFRGKFLRKLAMNLTLIYEQVEIFRDLSVTKFKSWNMPSDQVLSFIIQINNGSIGYYDHFADYNLVHTWYNFFFGETHIVHGDKSAYKKSRR